MNEYDPKPNKGAVYPCNDNSGQMILDGKLHVNEFKVKDDGYANRAMVVKENNGNLVIYLQCGILFPEPEDSAKNYDYSGNLGEGKLVFGYRNERDGLNYLGLSALDKDQNYAAAPAPVQTQPTADVVALPSGEEVAKNDIPF